MLDIEQEMGDYTQMAVKNGARSFLSTGALTAKCERSYPTSRMRALSHLLLLQAKLLAKASDDEIKPMELASCANAWGNLDKQRIFLIGQGWLYHLREKPAKDSAKSIPSWEEPKQVHDAVVVVSKQDKLPTSDAVQSKPDTTSEQSPKQ